tara:strand:- start:27 stop:212 length:186 start_codon:yes stop_codon:yes gene_type:complete
MNNKINQILLDTAIGNCMSAEYPILVNGADFGDDLANALNVIKELSNEVARLQKVIENKHI